LPELFQAEALAKVNIHRRIERRLIAKLVKPQKVLQIGVLADLLDGFLITDAKAFLDDQGAKR
jgi:hypothetical protein